MGISNKLDKHNNQYINIKISIASHNQDPEFLHGKPFYEKGKTRKWVYNNLPLQKMGLQQYSQEQMLEITKKKKINLELQKIIHNAMH